MADPLTLTAYAARRGVSTVAVSKAVRTGRLSASVVRDERGQPKIADPELADREWTSNTRQRADLPPRASEPASSSRAAAPAPRQSEPIAAVERPRSDAPPGDFPPYNVSQAIRAHHQARREAAMADMAELELAELRGELVDAKEADAGYEEHVARAKTRLLGVPAQLGQRMPDIALRVVPVAKELIREALEELSLDGQS